MRGSHILVAMAVLASVAISGCSTMVSDAGSNLMINAYTSKNDGEFKLPAIPVSKISPQYRRQIVRYQTDEKPGTIIVNTSQKHLYFVLDGGRAVRYGIGVGREGFEWSGTARVAFKREWPVWTPPAAMIKRQPDLAKYRGGMQPGLTNPLGARALYLYNKSGDTGYRLHGSPEWWSIGKNMSSGCIRLMNQDIIDLYNRAESGAKVIVM